MRQQKKEKPVCPQCGKPGTKWYPLPHDHSSPSVSGAKS